MTSDTVFKIKIVRHTKRQNLINVVASSKGKMYAIFPSQFLVIHYFYAFDSHSGDI